MTELFINKIKHIFSNTTGANWKPYIHKNEIDMAYEIWNTMKIHLGNVVYESEFYIIYSLKPSIFNLQWMKSTNKIHLHCISENNMAFILLINRIPAILGNI